MPWVEAAVEVAGEGVAAGDAGVVPLVVGVVVVGTAAIQPSKAAAVSCSEQRGCDGGRVRCVSHCAWAN